MYIEPDVRAHRRACATGHRAARRDRDGRRASQLEALGELIRAQRQQAELTLRELAARTNVSNPYLSQIERGLHEPSVRVLKAIAGAAEPRRPRRCLVQAGLLDGDEDGSTPERAHRGRGGARPTRGSTTTSARGAAVRLPELRRRHEPRCQPPDEEALAVKRRRASALGGKRRRSSHEVPRGDSDGRSPRAGAYAAFTAGLVAFLVSKPTTGATVSRTAVTIAVLASISFLAKAACDSTTSIGFGRNSGYGDSAGTRSTDELDALGDVLDDRGLGRTYEVEDLVLVALDGGEDGAHWGVAPSGEDVVERCC